MVSKSVCSWVVQGVKSTNGSTMSMWKTNFNMPVPYLFGGSSDWDNGFMCSRYGNIGWTSQSLSGFKAGYEVALADGLFRWSTGAGECLNGIAKTCIHWINPYGQTTFCYTGNVCINIGEYYNTWYEIMANQGVAGWEMSFNGTYCARAGASTISGDNLSISTCTTCFDIANIPSVGMTSAAYGSVWVEGNNLNYGNANCWIHSIEGCDRGAVIGIPGSIWIENSFTGYGGAPKLHWIGCDGHKYQAKWAICQFCSSFSNGAPANPSPGASYAGALWVDSQFGYTHLSYIGCDGNKYLTGAGNYPYTTPY